MATNLSAIDALPLGAPDSGKPRLATSETRQPQAPARDVRRVSGGSLPAGRQLQGLIVLLALFLALSAALTLVENRRVARNALYVSTATEMQMLSQRIANSAQQAVQGGRAAFGQLREARDQFVQNLTLLSRGGDKLGARVPPSPPTVQPLLQRLETQWRPVQANIELILAQEQNLIELREREDSMEAVAPQLSLRALELATSAADAREHRSTIAAARQLHTDVANFNFLNAVRLLSTDDPNPQLALQLGNNARKYLATLSALLGEGSDGLSAIADDGVRRRAMALHEAFAPFAESVRLVLDNMQALARAKQASRDVFGASEDLLQSPRRLVAGYQADGAAGRIYGWGAIAAAALALACLVLLGRVYVVDSRRRAAESEQQNRANQEAILRLLDEIGNLASGDLTVNAKVTEDVTGAIADSINYTVEELRRLVVGINGAAEQVTAATREAQTISGQLLQAAQKQAAEIQGTGHSVAQMAQSMNAVSRNAGESAKVAETSLHVAGKGAEAVQNAIRGMNDIREQIQETSKRIKRLGESSQEIGEIVQLISDITEQTNVLALNAAIQAASAGEAGRGFSVVAEEVQRLAERSAEATKHIAAIVKSIQRDTQDAVEAMERSTRGVVEGTRTADEADRALREIEAVSNRLAELIGSISNATEQQANSATQVAAKMKIILGITQLTTEGTKKTAASASKLAELADGLRASVAGFRLG